MTEPQFVDGNGERRESVRRSAAAGHVVDGIAVAPLPNAPDGSQWVSLLVQMYALPAIIAGPLVEVPIMLLNFDCVAKMIAELTIAAERGGWVDRLRADVDRHVVASRQFHAKNPGGHP